jgi:hypothetical protein
LEDIVAQNGEKKGWQREFWKKWQKVGRVGTEE